MMPILHTAGGWLASHAAPLVALVVAAGGAWFGRARKAGAFGPAVGAVALLAGWGWLFAAAMPRAIWAPHRGIEVLLMPAAVSALLAAVMAWRGSRNRRVLLGLDAAFAGWWVGQAAVIATDFWRVGFVVLLSSLWLGRAFRGETMRGLAVAATLWGGLAAADSGGMVVAAAIATAAWAGLLLGEKGAVMTAAPMAALIGAADLAGGRALRGRVDATDLACVAALLAPLVAGTLARRLGAKNNRFLTVGAAVLTAAALSSLVWLLRRGISG